MRIAITTVQVPFVRGGAEFHAEELRRALIAAGHEVDIVSVPFKWYPAARLVDQMAIWRLIDLSTSNGVAIDKVISLKFPAWLASHRDQVIWMLHQHREAYDLWGETHNALAVDPEGGAVRELMRQMDREYIPRARHVFANSRNVARRLEQYCGLGSRVLYHPPPGVERLQQGEYGDYLLVPARINEIKRQKLVIEAMLLRGGDMRVVFMGHPDRLDYGEALRRLAAPLGDRVVWTGFVSDEERIRLYANARAVVFSPVDEDYGYVTLEAMVSAKPVITCTDSGGSLEFVEHDVTGLIVPPDPAALAEAMASLWSRPGFARQAGRAGFERWRSLGISWDNAVSCLLG
jgi:glycosyltransferase involved in cell wall biosynthesis